MTTDAFIAFLYVAWFFFLIYGIIIQGIYTVLTLLGAVTIFHRNPRELIRDPDYVPESPLTLPVTIIAPAYNEETNIEQSIRSLLENPYGHIEVVVVNDGSTDETLNILKETFDLKPVPRAPRSNIPTEKVRKVYLSPIDFRLVVIDKENGGKGDALNVGVNYARYPIICSIDADSIVDERALERLTSAFQDDPETVVAGGTIRLVNGSTVEDGRITKIGSPKTLLENLQIAEYARAFLGGRVGWARNRMLLIVSGAFGLFRRDAVVEAGGYDPTTVGEDAELVLRMHKKHHDEGKPFKAVFYPEPACWTEGPSTWKGLKSQRDRWQRGLGETLWRHRDMVFKKKYGPLAFGALPYFWLFELAGPFIETFGLLITVIAMAMGILDLWLGLLILAVAALYGVLLGVAVIAMEDSLPGHNMSTWDILRLFGAVMVDSLGYRQWLAIVRVWAIITLKRKSGKWGAMSRAGFTESEEEEFGYIEDRSGAS